MNPTTPHQDHLETLLIVTQPQPDPDFEQQLESRLLALLAQSREGEDNSKMIRSRFSPVQQAFAVAAATILIATIVMFTVPPLRSMAQDLIDTIFVNAEEDTVEIIDRWERRHVVSVDHARYLSGLEIWEPVHLPDNLYLDRVYMTSPHGSDSAADRRKDAYVTQIYRDDNPEVPQAGYTVALTTYELDPDSEWWQAFDGLPVGLEATIETLVIGEIKAQYVSGSWQRSSEDDGVWDEGVLMEWSDESPLMQLWWPYNSTLIRLCAIESAEFRKADFTTLAERMLLGDGEVMPAQPPTQNLFDTVLVELDGWVANIPRQGLDFLNGDTDLLSRRMLTVETPTEAEELVGYPIFTPVHSMADSAALDRIWVHLVDYDLSSSDMPRRSYVSQWYTGANSAHFTINQDFVDLENEDWSGGTKVGASAEIETFTIGDVTLYYVRGDWQQSSIDPDVRRWSNYILKSTLSWWQGNFLMTITTHSYPESIREDMLAMAESIILNYGDAAVAQTPEQYVPGEVFVKVGEDTRESATSNSGMIASVVDASEFLGIEIFVPPVLPVGYRPSGAIYAIHDSTTFDTMSDITVVEQKYHRTAYNTILSIVQVRGYTASGEWTVYGGKPVGMSATIEPVIIGDVAAEYVRGGWRFDGNNQSMVWENDHSRQILAWWQNGEIVGVVSESERLTLSDLVAIVEGIVAEYGSSPANYDHVFVNASTDQQSITQFVPILAYEMTWDDYLSVPAATYVSTLSEAQSVVDFTIYQPEFPVTDLYMQWVTIETPSYNPYNGETITATTVQHNYGSTKHEYAQRDYQLIIRQMHDFLFDPSSSGIQIGSSAEIEHLQIRDVDTQYVIGGWRPEYSSHSTWSNDVPQQRLAWWQNGFLFQITEIWDRDMSLMSQERIIAIAESIIAEYQDDPSAQIPDQPVPDTIYFKTEEDTREMIQQSQHTLTSQERADFLEYNRFVDTVAEAEALVGYDIIEPAYLPDELIFREVVVSLPDPEDPTYFQTSTGLEYTSRNYSLTVGQIVVDSGRWPEDTVSVGASAALETVMIGDVPVQYVRGEWRASIDQTMATWDNDYPIQRMAWWQDGYLMHLRATSVDRLSREEFIAVAESIILQGDHTDDADIDFFRRAEGDTYTETKVWEPYIPSDDDPISMSLVEATDLAGFDPYQPTWTYELEFTGARFDPETKAVMQRYQHPDNEYVGFTLIQQQMAEDLVDPWLDRSVGAGATVETVQIGDLTGQFVRGRWYPDGSVYLTAEPGDTVTFEYEWEPYDPLRRLIWEQDGYLFELVSAWAFRATPRRDELIAIASSLVALPDD